MGKFGVPWAVLVPRCGALCGAAVRRDAGRGLAWRGSGVGLAPRHSKRGGRQNRRGNIESGPRQVARAPCSAAAGPDGVRRRGMLAHGAALTGRGAALMLAAARRWRRSRRQYRLGSRSGSWSLCSGQQLGSAGLPTQARRGRQLLLEGSGAAGGGIGSNAGAGAGAWERGRG